MLFWSPIMIPDAGSFDASRDWIHRGYGCFWTNLPPGVFHRPVHIFFGCIVASVDRKSAASHVRSGRHVCCRGFSITRLEGSRWCLRQTRAAMEKVRKCGGKWLRDEEGRIKEHAQREVVWQVSRWGFGVEGLGV